MMQKYDWFSGNLNGIKNGKLQETVNIELITF